MSKDQFNPAADDIRAGSTDFSFDGLPSAAENKEAERFSPEALMHKNRIVIIAGQVDAQLAYRTTVYIKHLEAMDPEKPITLLINSPGGSVIDGMSIVDIVRQCKCPIVTIGSGMQASMGSIFLAMGDQRFMTPNAQLMLHQIMTGANGGTQHTDFEIRSGHTGKLHESLKSHYVEFTGLTHEFFDIVLERDTWLSAEQALKMGFINGITSSKKPRGKFFEEATRKPQPGSPAALIADRIATMTKNEVLKALSNGQANQAEWGRYRPELVTRLSEFPEFWTKQRRAEAKQAAALASPSNDDVKAQPAAKAAKQAPKV